MFPRRPHLKGLVPRVVLLGGGGSVGGRAEWEVLRSLGVRFWRGSWDLAQIPSLCSLTHDL
jgi:hypothetical protein